MTDMAKNGKFEHGIWEKSFKGWSQLVYRDQSDASDISNGTIYARYTPPSSNHLTSSAKMEIIPVKTESGNGHFVTNGEIKVEPSVFDAEQSVVVECSFKASFREPGYAIDILSREHGDVIDNKDNVIVSSEHLYSSTSQVRDVGESMFLSEDQPVNSKSVLRCSVCSKMLRGTGALKRHEKWHAGAIRRKKHVCSNTRGVRNKLRQREKRSSQNVRENEFVSTNSIKIVSGFNDFESTVDIVPIIDHIENESVDNRDIQFKCTVCTKIFRTKNLLAKHEYHRHNSQDTLFNCSFCSKNCKTKTRLEKHSSKCQSNPEAVFKCNLCSKEFKSKYLLKKHEVQCQNSQATLFKCKFCSKDFDLSSLLISHENQCSSNPALFKCTVCSKEFGTKYFLKKHEQSENHGVPKDKLNQGAFACSKCSNSYSCESYLTKHKCKPYACSQCDKCFSDESRLKDHEVIHASRRPFSCDKCGKRFTVQKSLKLHELSHFDTKPFPCAQCDKAFVEPRQLKKHEQSHASDLNSDEHGPFQCTMCPKRFIEEVHLSSHIALHTNAETYTCNTCGKKYAHAVSLKSHMLVHTGEKPHACTKCGKPFRVARSLKYHMLTRHMARPYNCTQCEKNFSVKSLLEKHVRSLHRDKGVGMFMCTQCGKELSSAYRLQIHELQHTGKKYQCDECDKCYSHSYVLKLHKVAHKEKPFACTFCDQRFSEPSSMNLHIRQAHVEERPHMCPKCGQTFNTPTALMKHEECHKEKPFTCAQCGAKFTDSLNLKRHEEKIKGKCGNRKFVCSICGQKFAQASVMSVHMRVHTGERPYKCVHCFKSFAASSHLKEHIESVHSVDRPFQCLKCSKSFPTAKYLKVHDRSHAPSRQVAKSFVCDKCGKSFSASCGLKQHIRMHNGERPFGCTQCSRRFAQQSGLHHHIVLMHGDKVRCSWNAFDPEQAPSSFDPSTADSSVSFNKISDSGENSAVKIDVKTTGLVVKNMSLNAICASTIFEHKFDVVSDDFVPSPTTVELNDDGHSNSIEQAIYSLFPKTEPEEGSLLTDPDAVKQSVSTAVDELKNEIRKSDKMTDVFPLCYTENCQQTKNFIEHPVSSVVRNSNDKIPKPTKITDISPRPDAVHVDEAAVKTKSSLTSELLKMFLLSSDTSFYQPGLSSAANEQRTENSDKIIKKLVESDDDTVIDDGGFSNDDNDKDSDDNIRPSDNVVDHLHNGTVFPPRNDGVSSFQKDENVRPSNNVVGNPHNGTVRPPHNDVPVVSSSRNDVVIPQHRNNVRRSHGVSSKHKKSCCNDVHSDNKNTIDFSDLSANESKRLTGAKGTGAVEPADLTTNNIQPGNNRIKSQLALLLSRKEKVQRKKRQRVGSNDELKSDCVDSLEGSERAPKRQRRGKKNSNIANRVDKKSNSRCKVRSILSYKCTHCNGDFKMVQLLIEHSKKVHDDLRPFKCANCSLDFETTASHRQHEVRHSGVRAYPCTECDKSFMQSSHLQEHIRFVHFKERPFVCTLCNKRFPLRTVLRNHERATHMGLRKYICDQCGKGCATAQALKVHSRIHTGERPYTCTECDMSFLRRATLNRHMSRDHCCVQPHMCMKCGKTFPTTYQRNQHESKNCSNSPVVGKTETGGDNHSRNSYYANVKRRLETSIGRYSCKECGKTFTQSSSLKQHDLIHTGHRPYPCSMCNMHFRHNSTLRDHSHKKHGIFIPPNPRPINKRPRKKTQEEKDAELPPVKRRFQCVMCDKSYDIAMCLRRHVQRIHEGIRPPRRKKNNTDENPYVCMECGMCHRDARALRQHLEVHG